MIKETAEIERQALQVEKFAKQAEKDAQLAVKELAMEEAAIEKVQNVPALKTFALDQLKKFTEKEQASAKRLKTIVIQTKERVEQANGELRALGSFPELLSLEH